MTNSARCNFTLFLPPKGLLQNLVHRSHFSATPPPRPPRPSRPSSFAGKLPAAIITAKREHLEPPFYGAAFRRSDPNKTNSPPFDLRRISRAANVSASVIYGSVSVFLHSQIKSVVSAVLRTEERSGDAAEHGEMKRPAVPREGFV